MTTPQESLATDLEILDEILQKAIVLLCLDRFEEGLLYLERQFKVDRYVQTR